MADSHLKEPRFSLSHLLLGGLVLLLILPFTCTSGPHVAGRVPLTLWTSFDEPTELTLFTRQVRAFEATHPNVDVKIEQVGSSRRAQKYLAAMQAGACADVVIMHWRQVPTFAAKDMLVPLGPYIQQSGFDVEDFFPSALDAYRYQSQQVAIPEKGSAQLLFYNKTMFDAAGVPYPTDAWTMQDVVEAGKKLTRREPDGRVSQIGIMPSDAASWVWSMGGRFADDTLDNVYFTDPGTVRAVRFLWSLRNEWQISSRNLSARGTDASEVDTFENGSVAMAIGGPWNFAKYEQIAAFDWDIALFPKGPGGRQTRYAAMGYGIWSGSEHPREAWQLLSFLLSKDAMEARRGTGYADIPARRSVALGSFARQETPFDMGVLLRSMDPAYAEVKVTPKHEQWPNLERYFVEEFDRAMLGQVTPEEAMRRAQQRAEQSLATDRYEPGRLDYAGVVGIPLALLAGWGWHSWKPRKLGGRGGAA